MPERIGDVARRSCNRKLAAAIANLHSIIDSASRVYYSRSGVAVPGKHITQHLRVHRASDLVRICMANNALRPQARLGGSFNSTHIYIYILFINLFIYIYIYIHIFIHICCASDPALETAQ